MAAPGFEREDSCGSEPFPTVQSLDTLVEECGEGDAKVREELETLEKEAAEKGDDAAYWARLYHAISDDYTQEAEVEVEDEGTEEDDEDENIGIDKVLAKKQTRNVMYYQVRWKEHRQVTWERADDISGARALLTAFDTYLKKNPQAKAKLFKDESAHALSRREKKQRRQEKAEAAAADEVYYPSSAAPATHAPVSSRKETRAAPSRAPAARSAPTPTPKPTSMPTTTRAPAPIPTPTRAPTQYSVEAVLKLVSDLDAHAKEAEKNCFNLAKKCPEWPQASIAPLLAVYNEMFTTFCEQRYLNRFNSQGGDECLMTLAAGQPVPSYFANVSGESVWRRKMLSLAGLRNLVHFGRQIYNEMRDKLFIGDPEAYGSGQGPHKMKQFTGSVVDLDTTVLRCSDRLTLNAINEWNKHQGQPVWRDTQEFGASQQAQDIAKTAAGTLLERFNNDFKLSKAKQKERRVDPADMGSGDVPLAQHNTDRGRWPCWHYVNVGVDSFHVNVPSLDDVNGALLRAPLHCVLGWLHAKRDGCVDSFFDECIVDSCFNMKWKAIEEYNQRFERKGSINQVLEQLQADNQAVFNPIFDEDDEDNEKEIAAMVKLLAGATGRDAQGNCRLITAGDVAKWVNDPSQEI